MLMTLQKSCTYEDRAPCINKEKPSINQLLSRK